MPSLMCKCNLKRLLDPIYFPFLLVHVAFGIRQLQPVYYVLLISKVVPPKYSYFSEHFFGHFGLFHGMTVTDQTEGRWCSESQQCKAKVSVTRSLQEVQQSLPETLCL